MLVFSAYGTPKTLPTDISSCLSHKPEPEITVFTDQGTEDIFTELAIAIHLERKRRHQGERRSNEIHLSMS